MPTEDRRVGKQLPSPVTPATTVCYTITIPNAVQYRAAFLGQLGVLGQALTWDHPTDGTECADCEEAAQLFRNAMYLATWSDECEVGMSCEDVADCIETNESVRQAIQNVVPTAPVDGYSYPPGVPLTQSQMDTRLNEIDDCVYDAYWAQCEQFVDYMVDLGQDVLDQIAAYSAALDAGENVPMGQFLGKLKNSSTAGKVIDFLQWVLVTVKAQYEAADNTANRDEIKCAVFCAGKDDCLITIQGTLDVLNDRLGGLVNPTDLTDMVAMVDGFMAAIFNPALALDLWILFLMSSAKTAGMWGLEGIDETLNLVLAVAVNDANNDWEAKCVDCAEPPVGNCVDLTVNAYTWFAANAAGTPDANYGSWASGQGLIPGPGNAAFFARTAESSHMVSEVRITTSIATAEIHLGQIGSFYLPSNDGTQTTHVFNATSHPGYFPRDIGWQQYITFPGNVAPSGAAVIEFCYEDV